ncbi:MAG TPA: BamA/TamA family outer membrane protein [Chitinophagaceae bacterium]|nr:BamA/TamA family outer membrane protein [Chitinophagaceae bacterium]
MIKRIDKVFAGFPNLVHVAGHEHGLQLIKNNQLQIVSGIGIKSAFTAKKKSTLFANRTRGYVTADLLRGNVLQFTYYTYKEGGAQAAFSYSQTFTDIKAQEEQIITPITADNMVVKAYAPYNDVSGLHRSMFGEGYRKEWAEPTNLPVLKISALKGGLTPYKRGGGHQTVSLRMKDKDGNEWVLRSLEKNPEILLPEALRGTFAKDVLVDVMSAQHPYGPLIVPTLADAANVPHTNPVIGIVSPDKQLGMYQNLFANKVCLFEEREPLGNSDNTATMMENLNSDNDNSVDSNEYFRARLLDIFMADWDRHEDQWRWHDTKKGSGKTYIAIPRDRDQALYKNEGFFPSIASSRPFAPFLKGFGPKIKLVNHFSFEARNMDGRFLNQFNHEQWMKTTNDFIALMTDSVIETALKKLPESSYKLRHDELFNSLKGRRENLAAASEKYFYFLNKIADIRVSDKNELIEISDAPDGGLLVAIHKISKERKIREQLYSKTFLHSSTKEIRIFTGKGDDSIVVNTKQHSIRLRIIGGDGDKDYNILHARKKPVVYDKETASFEGMTNRVRKRLSNDSSNVAIIPANRYHVTFPIFTVGFNADDGLLVGFFLKHTHQGFRKTPASIQQVSVARSFATGAFRIGYKGEFLGRPGKADFIMQAIAKAPDNTQNFFGRGNETVFNKTGDFKRFYRTRFSIYQADPALRWRGDKGSSLTIGPSIQLYKYDADENTGRLITNTSLIGSYDSSTIAKNKAHLGLVVNFINDKRNNTILPSWGSYISIRLQSYAGLNDYSKSFSQIIPEVALYKPLNAGRTIVLAERFGGGISIGNTAFYQSMFIGGHENLLGYRQYRFAGQHSFYNNLELRIKISDFASYILPGQFGITGFFDAGRVWEKNDNSGEWHTGVGGGFYFAPAQLVVLQLVAGYSTEGWFPYFTMGFRF